MRLSKSRALNQASKKLRIFLRAYTVIMQRIRQRKFEITSENRIRNV